MTQQGLEGPVEFRPPRAGCDASPDRAIDVTRIALLDYGMGNLRSVAKALERVGAEVDLVTTVGGVAADGLVVPGQGAFGACRIGLDNAGSVAPLRSWIEAGRPYLGICLGLQILYDRSEESSQQGLGLFRGNVVRIRGDVKVPHIGWNQVRFRPGISVFEGLPDGTYFYFDHSYVPEEGGESAAWTEHGREICCGIARDALVAVQFHPEKSGDAGLNLLSNFVKECAVA